MLKDERKSAIARLRKCSIYGNEDKTVIAPYDSGTFGLKLYGSENRQRSLFFRVVDPTVGEGNNELRLMEESKSIRDSYPELLSDAKPLVIENFSRTRAHVFGYEDNHESLMDFHYYIKSDPVNLKIIFEKCFEDWNLIPAALTDSFQKSSG